MPDFQELCGGELFAPGEDRIFRWKGSGSSGVFWAYLSLGKSRVASSEPGIPFCGMGVFTWLVGGKGPAGTIFRAFGGFGLGNDRELVYAILKMVM